MKPIQRHIPHGGTLSTGCLHVMVTLVLLSATVATAAPTLEESRLYRTAKAAHADGLYEVSAAKWSELLQKYPRSQYADEARLFWAESLVHSGRAAEAVKLLEERLTAQPPLSVKWMPGYVFWDAEARLKLAQPQQAVERYQHLLREWRTSPYRVGAIYGLAVAYFKLGKLDEAEESLQTLSEVSRKGFAPSSASARVAVEEMLLHGSLLRGQIWLARGDFERAEILFREIVERNPKHKIRFEAWRWWGESLAKRQKWDESLDKFNAVLGAKEPLPNTLKADAWLGVATALAAQKKLQEAADACGEAFKLAESGNVKHQALQKQTEFLVAAGKRQEAVDRVRMFSEQNPNDPLADAALLWAADLLFDQKNHAEALKLYQSLYTRFQQSPLAPAAHNGAGRCLLALKREPESIGEFTEAAKSSDSGIASESQLKLADTLFVLRRFAEAASAYGDFLRRFGNSDRFDTAQYQLGLCWAALNKTEDAVKAFSSLVDREPQSPLAERALFEIGRTYLLAQDFSKARENFERYLQKFGSSTLAAEAALLIAQSFYSEGNYKDALQRLETFASSYPNHALLPRAVYDTAWCHHQMGDTDKARAEFTELLNRFPDAPLAAGARVWLADFHFRQKDYTKAREEFLSLVQTHPQSEWAETALYMAGRCAKLQADYVEAFKLFETLLQKYPQSRLAGDALFLQAECRAALMQFENAIALFDEVATRQPETALGLSAVGRKGDCLLTLKRYDEAVNAYRRIIDSGKADAELVLQARYKVGNCLEKQDNLTGALTQYADVVYGWMVDERDRAARDDTWFCRAAFDGARIAEARGQWREAIRLLEHVIKAGASMSREAEDEIRRIKVRHFDFR